MLLSIVITIILIINALLALGIFMHHPKRRTNQYYALFVILLDFFILSVFLENRPDLVGLENVALFLRLDFAFALLFFYVWFRFCSIFTKSSLLGEKYQWFNKSSFVVLLILLFMSLITNLILTNITFPENVILFDTGPLWPLYAFPLLFWALGGVFLLILKRQQSRKQRDQHVTQQIDIILSGFFLSLGVGLVIFLFLQTFFSISLEISQLGLYSLSILAFFTAYAIVRHQFLDIKIIIQRGLIYTALLTIIIGFYLILVGILGFFFQRATNLAILFSAGITTIVGIFGVPYIERYFRRVTDHLFFKDTYNYSKALQELSEILNKNVHLEEIFTKSATTLKGIFKTRIALFISTGKDLPLEEQEDIRKTRGLCSHNLVQAMEQHNNVILTQDIDHLIRQEEEDHIYHQALQELRTMAKRYRAEVVVPIIDGPLFLLFLGKKLSGDTYTQEDLRLLRTFANQASVAIKKAELYGRIKDYSHELERRVQKRTAELQTMQEGQRQMMIDISHSLQTPLTIIKGELSTLERQMPDSKELNAFERSLDKISKFIYDLLELTRLDTHEDIMQNEILHLSEILEDLVEYFTVLTNEKEIELQSNLEKDILIEGERKKIEELVINLVSNAVKYMREGTFEKTITISLSADETHAYLTVEDTGIGMNNDELKHIFDRFYRARESHTSGTGLGLTISKKIVERHHGTITVASQPSVGTKFTIQFPQYHTKKRKT